MSAIAPAQADGSKFDAMTGSVSITGRYIDPRSMLGWRPLTLLVLVVCHAALLAIVGAPDPRASERSRLVRDSLLVAQPTLLAAWAVLGPGKGWIRLVLAAILGAAPISFALALDQEWRSLLGAGSGSMQPGAVLSDYRAFAGLWVRFGSVLAVGVVLARSRGWTIRYCGSMPKNAAGQFTLRTLLVVTTLMAAALWAGPRMRVDAGQRPVATAFAYWSVAVPLALTVLGTVWAVLRPGMPIWRIALAVVWAGAMGWLPTYLCSRDDDLVHMASWAILSSAIVAVSLFTVRAAGAFLMHKREIERCLGRLPFATARGPYYS
jgi:hypothetical protein